MQLHMLALERAIPATASRVAIHQAMQAQFPGLGVKRINLLIQRLMQRWVDEDMAGRPHYKAAQMRRIMSYIDRASRGQQQVDANGRPTGKWLLKPDLRTVERYESLLADIQGTRAAIEIAVEHRLGNAAQDVFANMTAEELEEIIEEGRNERALANKARQLLGEGKPVRPVLEVVGEPADAPR